MLRKSLLFLSERQGLKNKLLKMPAARATARRFVAGEDLASAIEVARALEAEGFGVTLDFLGESVADEEEAAQATSVYEESFREIHASGCHATTSLKLTQLGLDISTEF